jgi:hypothetical protein
MKKIKNIIYIALFSLLAVSCEDNTGSITNPGELSPLPQEVKVSFTDENATSSPYEGETMTYRLEMPFAITGTVEVALSVTSSDGTVEAEYPTSITFVDGQSAVYFDVTPTDDGVVEEEIYTIAITGVSFSNDNYFAWTGENSRVMGVRDVPTPIVTTAGDFTFNFTWSGSSDLDCRLVDNPTVSVLDAGYTTSPGETVTLVDGVPDGDYLFRVRPWTVSDASIDYTIEIVAPTETRSYSGTFLDLEGGWSMEFVVLEINKATSGATVTYTINQL